MQVEQFLARLYALRFPEAEGPHRRALWRVLTSAYLQRWFGAEDTVVDIGGGGGEFLSSLVCGRRILVDLAPRVEAEAAGIHCIRSDARSFASHLDGPVDAVFVSNFFEHLEDVDALIAVLEEVYRALRPSGRMVVLQPNIRLVGQEYWDFIDHRLPITDRGLVEAVTATGFTVVELIPGFLPYTTKRRRLASPALLRAYLSMPVLWRVFGKQTFLVAERPPGPG